MDLLVGRYLDSLSPCGSNNVYPTRSAMLSWGFSVLSKCNIRMQILPCVLYVFDNSNNNKYISRQVFTQQYKLIIIDV